LNKIEAVIFDWAGTTVDYGSFAPINAFIAAFESFDMKPGVDEIRAYMGLPKRKHIEKILGNRQIAASWLERYGHPHTQDDVNKIYANFEDVLFKVLAEYADPLPGVVETAAYIRKMGIAIGSTTGYTRKMMDVIVPLAKEKGYAPDCIICPDDAGGIGRPYPYMLWRNLEKLGVSSIRGVLKAGDTAADMEEGKNAGCLCVGVLRGSSMAALTEKELAQKNESETRELFEAAKQKYIEAGADYVIEDISALPDLINFLNEKKGGSCV
jgi:phosphonoacetaldehyde hydrolase